MAEKSEQSINDIREAVSPKDIRILEAPQKLFHPQRILIMKTLALHGLVEFRDLKHALHISDGNLASHLRALEGEGYVIAHKEIVGRRMRTTYELTPLGLEKFDEFRGLLRSVL